MKKNMFLAAAAVVALASCNNASPKMDLLQLPQERALVTSRLLM